MNIIINSQIRFTFFNFLLQSLGSFFKKLYILEKAIRDHQFAYITSSL